tara:strand:- start:15715 stop:15963 length:249 start_codon:yes stop_codon:yes gene_type:complete
MITLLKKPTVLTNFGISKSQLYLLIQKNLITPPISISGGRSVAWPCNEVESIIKARIAGKSSEEIRLLVKVLVEKRKAGGDV